VHLCICKWLTNSGKWLVWKNQVRWTMQCCSIKTVGLPGSTDTSALISFTQAKWSNQNVAKQAMTPTRHWQHSFHPDHRNRIGSMVHIQQKYHQKQGDGRQRWPLVKACKIGEKYFKTNDFSLYEQELKLCAIFNINFLRIQIYLWIWFSQNIKIGLACKYFTFIIWRWQVCVGWWVIGFLIF
jgi:hypothetical protein